MFLTVNMRILEASFVIVLTNLVSLYNVVSSPPKTGIMAYVKSNVNTPPNLAP